MSAALAQACDKYLAVAPKGTVLRKARTPFIEESLLPDGQEPGEIEAGVLASSAAVLPGGSPCFRNQGCAVHPA